MDPFGVAMDRIGETPKETANFEYAELFAPKKVNQECQCSFCMPAIFPSHVTNPPIKFIERQIFRRSPPPLISSSIMPRNDISRDHVTQTHAQISYVTPRLQNIQDMKAYVQNGQDKETHAPKVKPLTNKNVTCICSFCSKSFTTTRALELHVRRHSGLRPFPCKFCDKSFYQPSERAVHMRTHTGARPYRCPYCLKLFRYSGDLKQHINIHTGQRPYQCETCAKAFTNHSTLRQHKRIHTGERPYRCTECGKTYRYHSSLKQHRNAHLKKASAQGRGKMTAE